MTYIYDILVNFSNILYEFYEWSKKDKILHIKRIPLIKVKSKVIDDLCFNNVKVDKQFLDLISDITEKYDFKKIKYASIFTDGEKVIVLEFNDKGEVKNRSKLLLEDEDEVNNYSLRCDLVDINYKILNKCNNSSNLTRKENNIRSILLKDLNNSYKSENYQKISYMYYEFFNKKKDNYELMYNELLESINNNFNKKHLDLYNVLLLEMGKIS